MPALGDVHIDRALTTLSLAYMNDEFVADRVLPPLPVERRSDKYFVYDRATFLQNSGVDSAGRPRSLRQMKGEAAEVDYKLSSTPFYAEEYARKTLVPDQLDGYADAPLQPEIDATMVVTEILKNDNEIAAARLSCTTTNYPTANKVTLTTGGSGTSWASYASANSKPLSNIRDGKVQIRKGIMREPNMALFTIDSAQTLADHPDIKDLVKYVHADALTSSGLPAVLRGLMTLEASTQKGTSQEGASTFTSGNVWTDENGTAVCLIFYRSADTGPRSMHFGRTFDAPDPTNGVRGINTRKYRWEVLKGTYVESAVTRDWRHVALDNDTGTGKAIGGYLISACTA